jgi:hypothetical protein
VAKLVGVHWGYSYYFADQFLRMFLIDCSSKNSILIPKYGVQLLHIELFFISRYTALQILPVLPV